MGSCCSHKEAADKPLCDISSEDAHRNDQRQHKYQQQAASSNNYAVPKTAPAQDNNRNKSKQKKQRKQTTSSKDNTRQPPTTDNYNSNRYLDELRHKAYENEQLSKEIKKLSDENNALETRLHKELRSKTSEISELQYKLQTIKKDIHGNNTRYERNIETLNLQIASLRNELKDVREEKDQLLLRYSALAGSLLTDGNANIADLSDENRPTKLAERYSEIYDNDWTEAFTFLTSEKKVKMNEETACSILVHVFCIIYSTCRNEADKEWKDFVSATQTLYKVDEMPTEIVKAAKDKRKKGPGVKPEQIKKLFKDDMGKIIHVDDQNKIENFICKSIDLCWRMAVQDPPVYVDTNLSVRDSPLNKNLFKPYTSSGQFIDFVVWPTLYLKEGGSVLSKGIAQGKTYQTPKQDYDNVEIKPTERVKILSPGRDQGRKSATADTSENTVKENATHESHPKGNGTDDSAVSSASSSLHIPVGHVSADAGKEGSATATEKVIETASRSKNADARVKKANSQSFLNKAEMNDVEKTEERNIATDAEKGGSANTTESVIDAASRSKNADAPVKNAESRSSVNKTEMNDVEKIKKRNIATDVEKEGSATATEGVTESVSRNKNADAPVKNAESQSAEMNAVEKTQERSSATKRMNKSLNESRPKRNVDSQSHSIISYSQWQPQQRDGQSKTVINIKK